MGGLEKRRSSGSPRHPPSPPIRTPSPRIPTRSRTTRRRKTTRRKTATRRTTRSSVNLTLSTDGLIKSFRGRRVVDGISVSVSQGEVVGLLGQNGAGKTTTFYMIVGLLRPERGKVMLGERNISGQPM